MGAGGSVDGGGEKHSVVKLIQSLDNLTDDGQGYVTTAQLLSLFPALDQSVVDAVLERKPTATSKNAIAKPTTAPHKATLKRGESKAHTTAAIKKSVEAGDWDAVATHLGVAFNEFDVVRTQ